MKIGSFGIFSKWTKVSDRLQADWQALEDLCYDAHWCIGIYSAYDLIDWGRSVGLLLPSERENWFNLLQN